MATFLSSLRTKTMLVWLPCSFLALLLLHVTSAFHGHFQGNQNQFPQIRRASLLTTSGPVTIITSFGKTSLQSFNGLQGDPLEDDRRQTPVTRLKKKFNSPPENTEDQQQQQQQQTERKILRPHTSSSSEDELSQAKPSINTNSNERKATTSTSGGVNLELRDPKERVLVRHATASAAYGVDDFKGKKKKIIKPWSSGRKKNKYKTNNTGGIAREAYGEELEVELQNRPEKKRLVTARTNSLVGSQDAAKALMSGGSKREQITEEDIAEEKRRRKYHSDDDEGDYDEDFDSDNDGELNLVRHPSSSTKEPESENDNGPNLVRLSSSIVRQPENDDKNEPNLVRLSSSIVRDPKNNIEEEPNLVRLESSIVKEPEKDAEELRFYTRSESYEEEENKNEEQRLVRAVPASQSSPLDEPKLVRPNIVKAQIEEPKLTRPTIVKAAVEEPKLVRPNVFRAKAKGPKLIRAKVQKQKPPEQNLVRAKIIPSDADVANDSSTIGTPLVRPDSSTISKDSQVEDFMYGASASTAIPTAVHLNVNSESRSSAATPKSLISGSNRGKGKSSLSSYDSIVMENLMYGAKQAAISPTAVSIEEVTAREQSPKALSTDNEAIDNLMYGAKQATASPIAVPLELKRKNVVRATENISKDPMYESSGSTQIDAAQSCESVKTESTITTKPKLHARNTMDDLMYGHQCSTSSPTAVNVKTYPTKYVKPKISKSQSSVKEGTPVAKNSSTAESDGGKSLLRASALQTDKVGIPLQTNDNKKEKVASKIKRYVKPTTSSMNHATDWDAANLARITTNPTSVDLGKPFYNKPRALSRSVYAHNDEETQKVSKGGQKTKKYVQPKTSLMNNAPNWDAVHPARTTSNPSVINVDVPKAKQNETQRRFKNEENRDAAMKERGKKIYIQPSASLMDKVPDWDAVYSVISSSNPSQVSVDPPQLRKKAEYGLDVKNRATTTEKSKKKRYSRASDSLTDTAPDCDTVQPAETVSNSSDVNIDMETRKNASEFSSDDKKVDAASKKKKYVQPSTSLMDNAPDWDAVQPAMTTSNPAVMRVDVQNSTVQKEYRSDQKKREPLTAKSKKKKYIHPSTSSMNSVPDWDAAKPVVTSYNPSVVNVDVHNLKKARDDEDESEAEEPKRKKYHFPSASVMDRAPDWDSAQPTCTTSNPSVVNVDGINRIGKRKRFVRPVSSSIEGEIHKKTRPTPADTPFEYKQVQSLPKENPAGAKPIRDGDEKTKLPAAIAHAAGSSSDGWTPVAHFPSDGESTSQNGKGSKKNDKRTRTTNLSVMESYDPDALQRPTGVIPLTVSSSDRDKTQLFRAEHSLEPVQDNAETTNSNNNVLQEQSSSSKPPSMENQGHDDGKTASSSKTSSKKLFLYDGGGMQPKEPWDFTMEGFDTKLDKNAQDKTTNSEKKLVAYDKKAGTGVTADCVEDSRSQSFEDVELENIEGSKTEKKYQISEEDIGSRAPKRLSKLNERTVSPFTRNVSSKNDPDATRGSKRLGDKGNDPIDDDSKDL